MSKLRVWWGLALLSLAMSSHANVDNEQANTVENLFEKYAPSKSNPNKLSTLYQKYQELKQEPKQPSNQAMSQLGQLFESIKARYIGKGTDGAKEQEQAQQPQHQQPATVDSKSIMGQMAGGVSAKPKETQDAAPNDIAKAQTDDKYADLKLSNLQSLHDASSITPGLREGIEIIDGESSFAFPWKYRAKTFEIHIADQKMLSALAYSLAVHAKDISADTPRDKFYRGVSGFHYSVDQICAWLNDQDKVPLIAPEVQLREILVQARVIKEEQGQYVSASDVNHVLAASSSKKRSLERNLRHERWHIFYDEDQAFKDAVVAEFKQLSAQEQSKVLKGLQNYNQENLPQLIEEWAIGKKEVEPLPVK